MKTEVEEFCERHQACPEGFSFAKRFAMLADVWASCPRGDWMVWMLRRGPKQAREVWVRIAYEAALHVLPIFEKRRTDDNRPRACLESVSKWLGNTDSMDRPTLDSRVEEARAAAVGAAYVAYADDDDATADAAYAAAAAGDYAERKWQSDMLRRVVGNPFDGWKDDVHAQQHD